MTYFLPHDIARCNRDDCPLHLECARWLDILPMDNAKYWFSEFPDKDCEYFIEKEVNERKK